MLKNLKLRLFVLITITGAILLFIFNKGSLGKNDPTPSPVKKDSPPIQTNQNDSPQIVSTKPDPLDETIIPADQIIEITFNKSLQNAPEFKVRIEPKMDFKVELSGDRKTAKIIPVKPYELGASYTLYIGSGTKFDGVGEWKQDKTFRFRTIKYRGI